ncbi:MAG: hypothetical protein PHD48_07695, partial [Alphaproteobacteria bacterium]|nr:hypothetical protein [Alphaproteobacteria bacterium]
PSAFDCMARARVSKSSAFSKRMTAFLLLKPSMPKKYTLAKQQSDRFCHFWVVEAIVLISILRNVVKGEILLLIAYKTTVICCIGLSLIALLT